MDDAGTARQGGELPVPYYAKDGITIYHLTWSVRHGR